MQEVKESLKSIQSDVTEIRVDVAAIKVDVAHHVKRSDATDARLIKLEYTLIGLLIAVVGSAIAKWVIS